MCVAPITIARHTSASGICFGGPNDKQRTDSGEQGVEEGVGDGVSSL